MSDTQTISYVIPVKGTLDPLHKGVENHTAPESRLANTDEQAALIRNEWMFLIFLQEEPRSGCDMCFS